MYDHATKAGNRGDVWKHAILTAVIYELLHAGFYTGPFLYAETHAGAGTYRLDEPRQAIKARLAADRDTCPLYSSMLRRQGPDTYLGSWRLVRNQLRAAKRDYRLILHEIDPRAARQAARGVRYEAETCIYEEDGFEDVMLNAEGYDFVFIDPPYTRPSDWTFAAVLANRLAAARRPFALWYPIDQVGRYREFGPLPGIDYGIRWNGGGCGLILGPGCPSPSRVDCPALRRQLGIVRA